MILKLTLQSGDVQEVPLELTTTLTVTNRTVVEGAETDVAQAWSEIVDVELVEAPAEVPATPETMSPAQVAGTGSTDDTTTDTGTGTSGEVPSQDDVVAAASATVEAAQQVATSDASPEEVDAHLAQAIADVDQALALYPESAELVDAKTQLEQLQAEQA